MEGESPHFVQAEDITYSTMEGLSMECSSEMAQGCLSLDTCVLFKAAVRKFSDNTMRWTLVL